MASIAPPPPTPIDNNALQALDKIVARAFAVEGGYRELNGIVSAPDAAGFNMFEDLGLDQSPMAIIVPALRQELQARGDGKDRACLSALLVSLPGNVELREWLTHFCPAMLDAVPQATYEAARSAYEKGRMERRVKSIQLSLEALAPGITLTPAQKRLTLDLISKLDELKDYKDIHDALHGLQMEALGELQRSMNETYLPSQRQMSIETVIQKLSDVADKIEAKFRNAGSPDSAVERRDSAVVELRSMAAILNASDPGAAATAETGAGLLRAELRIQMPLFDSKLVEASSAIPFHDFAEMIRTVPRSDGQQPRTASDDPILAANIGDSFADLETRLVRRRAVHRLWQRLDATLLNVEEALRGSGPVAVLRIHWENLARLVSEITALSADHGLFALPLPGGAMSTPEEFAAQVRSTEYLNVFGGFAQLARVRFQRADTALVNDCEELARLQRPLQALVGV